MTRHNRRTENQRRTGAATIFRHRHETCRATGRIRFRDSHQAAHALESARQARAAAEHAGEMSRRQERIVYRCEHCSGFHLSRGLERADVVSLPTGRARSRRVATMRLIADAA